MAAHTQEFGGGDNAPRLAYIARQAFEDAGAYRGGILVVDDVGTPLEFRCTSPVRPNPTQKVLYGENLDPHMLIELMGKPLLRSLRETYDLLLVVDPWLLNLREHSERPTIFVRRQGVELTQTISATATHSKVVEPLSERFEPVVTETLPEHSEDLDFARPLLQRCSKRFDVLEPFDRIRRALDKVHEEKTLDK